MESWAEFVVEPEWAELNVLTRLLRDETLAAAAESALLAVDDELPEELPAVVADELVLVVLPAAILYIVYVLPAIAEIVAIIVPSFPAY